MTSIRIGSGSLRRDRPRACAVGRSRATSSAMGGQRKHTSRCIGPHPRWAPQPEDARRRWSTWL